MKINYKEIYFGIRIHEFFEKIEVEKNVRFFDKRSRITLNPHYVDSSELTKVTQ